MHTRLKLLVTALAIIGAVVLFSWSYHPLETRLLKLATKVASLSESNHSPYLHYIWLTDHELLVFRSAEAGQWEGACQDVTAHCERPLTALTALLRRTKGLPWTVKPSPDGKWLLWEGAGKFIYAVTVEGTSFRRWPYGREERREDTGYSLWLADCSHFARITQHLSAEDGVVTRVTVHDIDHPETSHSLRFTEQDVKPNAGVSIVFPAGIAFMLMFSLVRRIVTQ